MISLQPGSLCPLSSAYPPPASGSLSGEEGLGQARLFAVAWIRFVR